MKKLLSIFMVLVMALSFASCSSTPKEIKAYVEANQAQVEATQQATGGVFEKVEMEARGKSVVYMYTYAEKQVDEDTVMLLEESFDSTQDAMQQVLVAMQDNCPQIESVIYEYYNGSGKLLMTREYK